MRKIALGCLVLSLLQGSPAWGQSTPPSPAASQANLELLQQIPQELTQAISSGNYFAIHQLCGKAGDEILKQKLTPASMDTHLRYLHVAFVSSVLSRIDNSGELGKSILKQLQGTTSDPEMLCTASLLLVELGLRSHQPALMDLYLPEATRIVNAYKGANAALYRYMLQAYTFARAFQKDPGTDAAAVKHSWLQALTALDGSREAWPAGGARFFWLASGIWQDALLRRGASLEEVEALVQRASKGGQTYEFGLGEVEARLNLCRAAWERGGDVEACNRSLDDCQRQLSRWQAEIDRQDQAFWAKRRPIIKFTLGDGDASRVQASLHQLRYRSNFAGKAAGLEGPELEKAKSVLMATEEANNRASMCQGFSDLDSTNWDVLDIIIARRDRNPNWQKQALGLLELTLRGYRLTNARLGIATSLMYRAEVNLLSGGPKDASAPGESDLKECIDIVEKYIGEVGGSQQAGQEIRQRFRRAYDLMAQLELQQGKTREAFETLGRWQQIEGMTTSAQPQSAAFRSFNSERLRLANLEGSLQRTIAPQDSGDLQQKISDQRSRFYTEMNKIRRDYPQFESKLSVRPVNFSKLQVNIPRNAAVVQFLPLPDKLILFVATHERLWTRVVPVTEAELLKHVLTLRRQTASSPAANPWNPSTSEKLYGWLVEPVLQEFPEAQLLAFVPTGVLHYVPFPALSWRDSSGSHFLIESKQCVVVSKSSDLDSLSHPPTDSKKGVVALGNPDGTLPGAEQECREIQATVANSKAYLGPQATRQALTAGHPSFLHFATHGVLNSGDPDSSFVVLAGKGPEGRLTIPQIYELNLNGVRLVTLSACQTALAEREPKSELASLAEAFSIAGTSSVVASLWSVSDESTRQLMVKFYRGIEGGKPLALALQEAQQGLIRDEKYRHPFYWSAFVLIGDWR